jgi:hypothetical protein
MPPIQGLRLPVFDRGAESTIRDVIARSGPQGERIDKVLVDMRRLYYELSSRFQEKAERQRVDRWLTQVIDAADRALGHDTRGDSPRRPSLRALLVGKSANQHSLFNLITYQCAHHAEVRSRRQGKCPECSASLQPFEHPEIDAPFLNGVLRALEHVPVGGTYQCVSHLGALHPATGKCGECGARLVSSRRLIQSLRRRAIAALNRPRKLGRPNDPLLRYLIRGLAVIYLKHHPSEPKPVLLWKNVVTGTYRGEGYRFICAALSFYGFSEAGRWGRRVSEKTVGLYLEPDQHDISRHISQD